MLHCTVVITLGNLASFPSYIVLPCAYDIYYDKHQVSEGVFYIGDHSCVYSYYIHVLINTTCAGEK